MQKVVAMSLELVPLPVADVDRTRDFYLEKLGFHLDHDVQASEKMRIVQMTPPGSVCAIVVGTGMGGGVSEMAPGTVKGLHLVVADIEAARATLVERGVEMEEIVEFPGGIKDAGFGDPDGNTWTLQEIPEREEI